MIDVAIGLVLLLVVFSSMASGIVELGRAWFNKRAENLWDSLRDLLGDGEAAAGTTATVALYKSAPIRDLIRARGKGGKRTSNADLAQVATAGAGGTDEATTLRTVGPPRIDGASFARGLLEAVVHEAGLTMSGTVTTTGARPQALQQVEDALTSAKQAIASGTGITQADLDASRDAINDALALVQPGGGADQALDVLVETIEATTLLPSGIKDQLLLLAAEAGDSLDDFRAKIEGWYTSQMAAVSAWYKRHTRWWLFGVGLVLAVVFNLDLIGTGRILLDDQTKRDAMVALATVLEC
jgi:hypothetical protein